MQYIKESVLLRKTVRSPFFLTIRPFPVNGIYHLKDVYLTIFPPLDLVSATKALGRLAKLRQLNSLPHDRRYCPFLFAAHLKRERLSWPSYPRNSALESP